MQLIQVEAINIYSSVYDTEQLSVIRGSSFLLKKAIVDIKEKFKEDMTAVSTGASSGLFEFKEVDNAAKKTIRDMVAEISRYLNDNENYRHFTFAVGSASHKNFQQAKEILIAKQRFRQLQSIAIAPDPQTEENSAIKSACAIQGNRRSAKEYTLAGDTGKSLISQSVFDRIRQGIDNRSAFYLKEFDGEHNSVDTKMLSELKFTSDIQSLSESAQHTKLSDKIAVLYLDGNKLSSIQRAKVTSVNDQKKFDNTITGI